MFRHLYSHLRKRVLLVDFDPHFNLTQAVVSQTDYEAYKAVNRTIFSVMEDGTAPSIFKVSSKLGRPPNLEDVSIKLRHFRILIQRSIFAWYQAILISLSIR
ncbi:ParA family protein [Paraburkholderia acidisoli]|uniref:Uncharacterized protein n=1 Tax=Paraburkholderia acidisoli TaxID=2571748 RepID=A0A7Z2JGI8_9BURK|nr:hypothetical protein FAZ98_18600 [Paraburkholderia acidisoli]